MCMGMMNYRKPKEESTVISCRKCGRAWQVSKKAAKHYNEYYKGICADCRNNQKGKVSLLKKDETEEIKAKICDELCIWASVNCNITQDELDERCDRCIVNRIEGIETK